MQDFKNQNFVILVKIPVPAHKKNIHHFGIYLSQIEHYNAQFWKKISFMQHAFRRMICNMLTHLYHIKVLHTDPEPTAPLQPPPQPR